MFIFNSDIFKCLIADNVLMNIKFKLSTFQNKYIE